MRPKSWPNSHLFSVFYPCQRFTSSLFLPLHCFTQEGLIIDSERYLIRRFQWDLPAPGFFLTTCVQFPAQGSRCMLFKPFIPPPPYFFLPSFHCFPALNCDPLASFSVLPLHPNSGGSIFSGNCVKRASLPLSITFPPLIAC